MIYNVLYISNESELGGAAQSLIDMLVSIKDKFIKPIVVIPQAGSIEEKLRELQIDYYIVYFSRGYGKIGVATREDEDRNFKDNYMAACQLQDIIKKEQIDLIHINSSVTNVGAFAALLANIPYVWHFREFLEEDFDSEFWDKKLKKNLIDRAACVITISKAVQDSYKKKYNINSVCIYDGIDTEKYKSNLYCMHGKMKIHQFIIVGNMTEGKGQFDAVRAMKILKDNKINNIKLLLVGNASEQFAWLLKKYIVKNELEQYISIMSFQKNLIEIRKQCDYSLTTSKMEALGRVTIEAMLAGHIVIGADTGGTKEIIGTEEERGYLYRQGDCAHLATVMMKVLNDDEKKKEVCRQKAQGYVEKTYALDTYGKRIVSLYESVLQDRKKMYRDTGFLDGLELRYRSIGTLAIEKKISTKIQEIDSKWLKVKGNRQNIGFFLYKKGFRNVAIYGMGNLGCRLYDEIQDSDIRVLYVVDKKTEYLSEVIHVKCPEEKLVGIDLLIVTVVNGGNEIVTHYKKDGTYQVRTLSKILDEMIGTELM